MNISMTSLIQNNKLSISQIARANLIAGTLFGARQMSDENGFDEWVEVLIESYVCQTSSTYDFHSELSNFVQFVNQGLVGDNSDNLKNIIFEDIQATLKAIDIFPKLASQTCHVLKAA